MCNNSFLGNHFPYFYFFHPSHKASSETSSNVPGQTGDRLLGLRAGTGPWAAGSHSPAVMDVEPCLLPAPTAFHGAANDFSALPASHRTQPPADLCLYDTISIINGSIHTARQWHNGSIAGLTLTPPLLALLSARRPRGRAVSAAGDPHHPQHHPHPPPHPPVVCAGGNAPSSTGVPSPAIVARRGGIPQPPAETLPARSQERGKIITHRAQEARVRITGQKNTSAWL